MLGLRSPSLDSALRASLWLSKIAPGDFVAMLTPTYRTFVALLLAKQKKSTQGAVAEPPANSF